MCDIYMIITQGLVKRTVSKILPVFIQYYKYLLCSLLFNVFFQNFMYLLLNHASETIRLHEYTKHN